MRQTLLRVKDPKSCRVSGSVQQPAAADAFQRPLRSRFQARLSRSVRLGLQEGRQLMSTLVTYASGYPPYYRLDSSRDCPFRGQRGCNEHEVNALLDGGRLTFDPQNPEQAWWPRTQDFLAEANKHSRSPVPVGNMTALVTAIQRQRGLHQVIWFGHGASGELQFGAGQSLATGGVPRLPNISQHFAQGGFIDFYSCNTGQSQPFLQSLANALRVTVRGFSAGVRWNLHWEGTAPHRRITSRGIDGRLPTPNIIKTPT